MLPELPTVRFVRNQAAHKPTVTSYRRLQLLGRGGFASVYLGLSSEGEHVALKVVPSVYGENVAATLYEEARLLRHVDHPNVAKVIQIATSADGDTNLALEYVHGYTLSSILRRAQQQSYELPAWFCARVLDAVSAGLHHAHEHRDEDGAPLQIVHRDVNPSNVMIGHNGAIKLIDFGIAKARGRAHSCLTKAGTVKGKLAYMSPEQVTGQPVDRRSDVFALGILLYELTTQRRAFSGSNDYETMQRIVAGRLRSPRHVRPGYSRELEDVMMTALCPQPEQRFQSAQAFRNALRTVYARLAVAGDGDVGAMLSALFPRECVSGVRHIALPTGLVTEEEDDVSVVIEPPGVAPRNGSAELHHTLAHGKSTGHPTKYGPAIQPGGQHPPLQSSLYQLARGSGQEQSLESAASEVALQLVALSPLPVSAPLFSPRAWVVIWCTVVALVRHTLASCVSWLRRPFPSREIDCANTVKWTKTQLSDRSSGHPRDTSGA